VIQPAEPAPGSAAATVPAPQRQPATERDLAAVAAQLGRPPRGIRAVAHRCPCGLPDAVETAPRLADGTPFPTFYYLTCPRAVAACSQLESAGLMRDMVAQLAADPDLAVRYRAAHTDYLARREAVDQVPEITGVSAGGMPGRVKCLHVHLGHALAAGPGVNPFGDQVLDAIEPWWADGPCVSPGAVTARSPSPPRIPVMADPSVADSIHGPTGDVVIRRARTADIRGIQHLIDTYSSDRRLLSKATVTLYEDVQEFWVAVRVSDGAVVGCGALHVMWEDLAEIRTVAVDPACRGRKIGHRIVSELLAAAREVGVARVFVLTFETRFFGSFGFVEIDGAPVPPPVYEQLLRSYDEGVAEFLGLERVKPNTLGNTRMLLHL